MLEKLNLEYVLFLDIETVPQYATYDEVPDTLKKLWDSKAERLLKQDEEKNAMFYGEEQ